MNTRTAATQSTSVAKTQANREHAIRLTSTPGAFDRFYRDRAPALVRYVRHFVWEAGEVEEVAQEAWLRFHRGLPKFKGQCTAWTYLRQIARYAAYDHVRSKCVRPRLTADDERIAAARVAGPSVSRRTSYRELLDQASERPPNVPPASWEAFWLHEIEGWTLARIAVHQDIPQGTAGTRIYAARHRLREHLCSQGLTPDVAHSTVVARG